MKQSVKVTFLRWKPGTAELWIKKRAPQPRPTPVQPRVNSFSLGEAVLASA